MSYEKIFLSALFFTLLAEVPIVFLLAKYLYKKTNIGKIIFSGILTSTLTLPYFWFILPVFINNRMIYILLGESLIVIIEAFIYYQIIETKFIQALAISLIANIASILLGLLIF